MILRRGVQLDPQKIKALSWTCQHHTMKESSKGSWALLTILGRIFPRYSTAVCDPLPKTDIKQGDMWTWNASYQSSFVKGKLLIKSDMCMKFYDDTKPLYLKTDACLE